MFTVVETPEFIRWASQVWREHERIGFIDWIAANPLAGDVIPSAGGLRKVRWVRMGLGKRGGARIIYFVRQSKCEIVLLLVYSKSKFDNLRPEFLVQLKEHFDDKTN